MISPVSHVQSTPASKRGLILSDMPPAARPVLFMFNSFAILIGYAPGGAVCASRSVVEQTNTGEDHNHVILITALDHRIITNASAGLCDVFHTALISSLNIV